MKRDYYSQRFLSYDIRSHSQEDDLDFPADWGQFEDWPPRKITSCVRENHGIELMREFSDCNQYSLLSEFMKVRESAKVIVEIGVARLSTNFYEHTSTTILLNNKLDSTIYLGIDVDDKSFLNDPAKNIFTLQSQSENYEIVQLKLNELGITKIDFLFIDGWHSVNQVLDELFYVDLVVRNGIIGYHDTNFHPGPRKIIEAMRPEFFEVRKHCTLPTDFGVAFATKKI
jgi:hypothetical protein